MSKTGVIENKIYLNAIEYKSSLLPVLIYERRNIKSGEISLELSQLKKINRSNNKLFVYVFRYQKMLSLHLNENGMNTNSEKRQRSCAIFI